MAQHIRSCGYIIVLLIGLGAPASAATLYLSSGSAALGESAKICISLKDGEDRIAGLQTNLVWDGACMTPTNGSRLCRADPSTGKQVQSALQGRDMLKAILISFSDVNPIPDGPLFCCEFTAVGNEGTRCPPVQAENIIGSTSNGTRLNDITAANTGGFTILPPPTQGEGAPVEMPTQATSNSQQGSGGSGCAIAAGDQSRRGAFTFAVVALLLAFYRRLEALRMARLSDRGRGRAGTALLPVRRS